MKNAVIYARFSSHGQNEQTIDGQIRICREYAENLGYNVINVYADKARSGTNDHRQDFQRMIKDAASETFQYIIVYMLDRFARNRRDSVLYKEMLKEKYNIKVLSATQQISDDEGGEFYEMFLEWNDEKYSKRLSKRIHLGLDTCVENGTYTGARLIYGYKLVDTEHKGKKGAIHKVAVDEEQAKVVRYIFEQYARGMKKQEIANSLNTKGITYKGKQYTKRTFENWLLNRKYTGKCYIGGRLCENTYPQIIDEITFEKVQKRLARNRHFAGTNKTLERYLLTGKAYCGYCGSLMTADAGTGRHGKKHYYYVCHKKRKNQCHKKREERYCVEKFVTTKVQEFLLQTENAQRVAVDTINYYEQRTGDDGLKSIDARIANINREVETMTNAFIHAQSELLQLTIEKKMHEQEILLADLQKQKAQIMHERGRRLTVDKILDFITNLVQGDPNDKEYQRLLIDNLISRVYIFDDDVVPIFNLGVDKSLEQLRKQETDHLIDYINGVRVQTAMLHHRRKCSKLSPPEFINRQVNIMLEMVKGCKVPRCDLLTEQCERTEYGFLANVNASKIKGLMRDFLLRQTSPVFLVLELPTNKFAERPLRQNDQAPMHKDVYYLDGLAIDDAVALLEKYGELLVHDGLSNFGFGAHDATAEIMLGKYNIVNLFAKDTDVYQEFLNRHGITLVQNCLTAWDTFNHPAPGEAWLYKVDGKSVYDVAEELKSRGLYFAERREDW